MSSTISRFKIGSLAACVVLISGVAFAAETIDVPAGRSFSTKIGTWDSSNCQAGEYPALDFAKFENGTITKKKGRSVEPAGSACAGKNLPGWIVTYKPNKGFRGEDCGAISLNFSEYVSGGNTISKRYNICFNVK
jgi:hypothetical protein